ncbi:ArnT family glycosyltransferase [Candidatus Margulisiibacteriota bacterium]
MKEKKAVNILWIVTWVILSILILFCLLNCLNILRNPYPDNYVDGIIVTHINLLLEKGTYFLDIQSYPFIHAAYPPVFIMLAAIFFKIFGPGFLIIRLLSFMFFLALAWLIYIFIKQQTKDQRLSLYFSGLLFAPIFIYHWIAVGRVDTLAILFTVAGLFFYVKDQKKIVLPILLFTCAFFTKQTAILGAGAVFLDLWLIKKDLRKALDFFAYQAGAILGIFLVLTLLTQGQFFAHLITYTKVANIELPVMFTKYVRFFRPLAILSAFVVYGLITQKMNVLSIYFLLNVLFLITSGKDGAASNYFIEPFISMILCSALMISNFLKKNKKGMILIFCLLLFQVVALVQNPRFYLNITQQALDPQFPAQAKLARLVRNTPENILAEDVGYLTMNNKPVLFQPFQFMKMAKAGMWDPNLILNDCYRKKFSLILAGERIKDLPGMKTCLRRSYRKTGRILDMDIYQ